MSAERTSDLWWKNAVVYCVDVETFVDWNGDGVGDFAGLTERVDYLCSVGVTCLWLMPFHASAHRDDGYDVIDYFSVDPRLGDLGDFVAFLRTAHDRGLRVITDLVVNHTSDRHPWFRASRSSRTSPFRDYYVWRDRPDPTSPVVFPGNEDQAWTRDDKSGQWYLHHFYSHQPDLNLENPDVRTHIAKVVSFWLELGVDGFRVDAAPFLGSSRTERGRDEGPHRLLKELRALVSRRRGDAILLGEVNQPPRAALSYFGDSGRDEFHMLFNFTVNQALFLSLATRRADPIRRALAGTAQLPNDSQWAMFIRNHDELTLDQLTARQREKVFTEFGPDPSMQLYGRGIRRRLPPMLDGDADRIRLVYSLLLSLPGTPVLFYGEEIGMGENLDLRDRLAVRTVMQWSADRTAGFTTSEKRLVRRPPGGEYGPAAINVAAQHHDPQSLLTWFRHVIHARRQSPELGWGRPQVIDGGDRAVLIHRCDWEGGTVVALHNLSPEPRDVTFRLADAGSDCRLTDLLGDDHRGLDRDVVDATLGRYGYRWWRLETPDARPAPPSPSW